jgi:hypothetical protein
VRWDSRGLWYWIPCAIGVWSFFVDQPTKTIARGVAFGLIVLITAALRRSDPDWGRPRKATYDSLKLRNESGWPREDPTWPEDTPHD